MIEFKTIEASWTKTEIEPMIYKDVAGFRAAWSFAFNHKGYEPWFMGSEDEYEELLTHLTDGERSRTLVWFKGEVKEEWLMSPKEFNRTITGREKDD